MSRESARALARLHLERGEPLGWFEPLYQEHRDQPWEIPWADAKSNPNLAEWLDQQQPAPGEALVVGCGLGDDARELESRGFAVTAFDLSPTAIAMCQARFPESRANWTAADLFQLPREWMRRFPLVVSLNTLQVLPASMRRKALDCIASTVAVGGSALVIVRGRESTDAEGEMPWPLVREELHPSTADVRIAAFDDYVDREDPPVRRFRVHYTRVA